MASSRMLPQSALPTLVGGMGEFPVGRTDYTTLLMLLVELRDRGYISRDQASTLKEVVMSCSNKLLTALLAAHDVYRATTDTTDLLDTLQTAQRLVEMEQDAVGEATI